MLVDSHCHLNLLEYSNSDNINNLDDVIYRCIQDDISKLLCVSIDLEKFDEIIDIINKYTEVPIFASAGVHPNECVDNIHIKNNNIDLYKNLLHQASHDKVIAIGETGLDYYRTDDTSNNKQVQQDKFITHIEIARKLNKPLIIHTRNASDDTIEVLKSNKAIDAGGIMHCFTEDWMVAKKALDLGFYISLSGIVTFKNAKQVHEVACKVPLDRLLVETDSPYLAPMPNRGKSNYPNYVKYVADRIANLRGLSFEQLCIATTENFNRLFNQ